MLGQLVVVAKADEASKKLAQSKRVFMSYT